MYIWPTWASCPQGAPNWATHKLPNFLTCMRRSAQMVQGMLLETVLRASSDREFQRSSGDLASSWSCWAHCSCWEAPQAFWGLLAAPGCSCGSYWLLLAAPGGSWRPAGCPLWGYVPEAKPMIKPNSLPNIYCRTPSCTLMRVQRSAVLSRAGIT